MSGRDQMTTMLGHEGYRRHYLPVLVQPTLTPYLQPRTSTGTSPGRVPVSTAQNLTGALLPRRRL